MPVEFQPLSRRKLIVGAVGGTALLAAPHVARAAVELRYLNHETEPRTVVFLRNMAAEYKSATGVNILIETEPDPFLKLTTSLKSGKPYDFMTLPSITDPILMARLGATVPVTDIVKAQGLDDFGPRCLPYYQDEIWGYPYDYNNVCLYYRTDWLTERGLKVPTDWDGFLQVLEGLNQPEKKRYAYTQTVAVGGDSSWANSGFLWANDVKFWDNKWNVLFDQPDVKKRAAESLVFIKKTAEYSPPGLLSARLKEVIANFVSGTAGIAPYAGRLMANIADNAPDLADRFTLGPYVQPHGGKGVVTGGIDVFAVGKSNNTEEGKKLLRWMLQNDKITQFQLTLPLHYQPVQYSSYKNKSWLENPQVVKFKDKLDIMRGFLSEENVRIDGFEYRGPEFSPNNARLYNSNFLAVMYQGVITGKMSPEEAVDAGAARLREMTTDK